MKALLVIDVQTGLVEKGDFQKELSLIERTIKEFQINGDPVIFMKHLDEEEQSPLFRNSKGSDLHVSLQKYAKHIIEKQTPSSFFNTNLSSKLEDFGVSHIFISGFNTEYCCMFTAIAAFDRGYKVTFLEDATATVNSDETYEMRGLDINDFVGSVLYSSNAIEVLNNEEYVEKYKVNNLN
ncbi:isochorismatase family protein [Planococcus sp. A6]|uniref:isochorismatase family protein n=1 Tax=Planococcus sp. A6 TaxID=2992760 RepID=UPI00237C4AA2|nr:isochorismatase family protein [Planococcus sp. A6]MDE0581673.1 isochorismatase family protein [Planococcus sp. A6]